MKRLAFAPALAAAFLVVLASAAFAQTRPGAQAPATKAAPVTAAPAPATPARFTTMVKGKADIQVIQATPKKVGNDMVTVLKIKNMSPAAISLLKVDEYWYDKKMQLVSGDTEAYRKPFNAGEVIEITMKSPVKPDLYKNQFKFTHANGDVNAKAVKKFD
ncbi:MAG: hypothetical protein V7647_4073 [Acidobacteriota bacterium]|jgi:hypothetical protein